MDVKQGEIGQKVKASIQKSGRNPALLKSIIMTAIYALELLISKVFKVASQKVDKGMETVAKAEPEQTPAKRVKSFVKVKSEPVPEMPKKSALASKYPRLADIYNKLEKQNTAIYEREKQLANVEKELAGAKGIFKAKQRKELQEQEEQIKTQIGNMKQYLSSIVQGYDDVPDTLGCFGWCDHILLLHTLKAYKTTMEQARDASDELVWQDTPEGKKPQMVRTAYGAVEWIEEQKNWIAEDMEKNIGWKRLFKGKNERGDLLLSDYRRERAAEKALEAEHEKERKENALRLIQTLSEKTIKKLDEEISAKNITLECTDALIEIRKNDMAEWEEKAEYSKSEYLKADELLTDKKKEVEEAQGELSKVTEELDEATRKKEIALDLYHRLSTDIENTDLFDKVVDLIYENEQLRSKIQILQDKLEKAYEFMKQFVINGRNMLDVFRERIGEVKEWVHRKVAGMGR